MEKSIKLTIHSLNALWHLLCEFKYFLHEHSQRSLLLLLIFSSLVTILDQNKDHRIFNKLSLKKSLLN